VDTAEQVLEIADRAHSVGRRLVRLIRIVGIVFAIGGVLVAFAVLFDRLWRGLRREEGDETTEVTGSCPLMDSRGARSDRMRRLAITRSRTKCSLVRASPG